jgi:autophagy-related protein 9
LIKVYFIEQLLSPITTPFLLLFWLKPKSMEIVDFFRNFTIDVAGVGDVCSFSQMDTQKHGNPKWLSKTKAKGKHQAKNGKTELSLIHFSHTNPQWKMPKEAQVFMEKIKENAQMESNQLNVVNASISNNQTDSLTKSLYHLESLVYNLPSAVLKSNMNQNMLEIPDLLNQKIKGDVSRLEGPLFTSRQERHALLTIAQASTLQLSGHSLLPLPSSNIISAVENSLDMNFSALYMHELHRKYHHGEYLNLDSINEENINNNGEINNLSISINDEEKDENTSHRYQTESTVDV